jgi:hypothetical protein
MSVLGPFVRWRRGELPLLASAAAERSDARMATSFSFRSANAPGTRHDPTALPSMKLARRTGGEGPLNRPTLINSANYTAAEASQMELWETLTPLRGLIKQLYSIAEPWY